MIDTTPIQSIDVKPNLGVNEVAAVSELQMSSFLEMENFRLSKDGDRIEKRGGLSEISHVSAADVFGYSTYTDLSGNYCQLTITESAIWRKVGSGAWTSIHTWASTLAHPVKVIEINGKKIIMTEIENVCIDRAGNKVQVGITAPTTLPVIAASCDTALLAEDCSDISDWVDEDSGAGASSQATFDSRSTFRFLNTGASGDMAKRTRTVAGFGPKTSFDLTMYINTIGAYQASNYFEIDIYNGRILAKIRIDQNDIYVYSGNSWVSCGVTVYQDRWFTLKFLMNTEVPGEEFIMLFRDNRYIGDYFCKNQTEVSMGKIDIYAKGSTVATDVYVDSINAGTTSGGNLIGQYRYAMSFIKSGNYGFQSNPIRSKIGTVAFTVAPGLNDMTVTGEYTGDRDRTFRVYVDANGTPDTFKWSEDGGATWNSTTVNMAAKVYINYGLELNFAATTGHTIGNYWEFTASAMAVSTVAQKVTLSSLQVSSDAQVDMKRIWRTTAGGTVYYFVADIPNSQTSYVDNLGDWALGETMTVDHETPPLGKFAQWWDDRLWVFDEDENMLYYSAAFVPEEFSVYERYISVKNGKAGDVGTGIIPYKSHLYTFKKNSILLIRKNQDGTYSRYEVCNEFGCIAPWSLVECYGLLTFLSWRGWEVFNGCEGFSFYYGLPISRSLSYIQDSSAYLSLIQAVHNREYNEVWLSIPDPSTGTAFVAVSNYLKANLFYFFRFHKTLSGVQEAIDSTGKLRTFIGTRDGYVFQADSGTQDGTTNITSFCRTPWLKTDKYAHFRNFEAEFEAPTGITLTTTFFLNMQAASYRTGSHTGMTPGSTDTELRRVIHDKLEMALRGQYFSVKFANAENVGSALKINSFRMYFSGLERKKKIEPNNA